LSKKAEFKLNYQVSLVALLGICGLGTQPQPLFSKEPLVHLWDWTSTFKLLSIFLLRGTSTYT